jgi:putative SOS response-associated peptidase YedK
MSSKKVQLKCPMLRSGVDIPNLTHMCGRFALYTEPVKVARFLQATPDGVKDGWQPSWNIPPTERIVGARERVDENGEITRSLELYRWGLVPFRAKDPAAIKSAFNARAKTVARGAF